LRPDEISSDTKVNIKWFLGSGGVC
jgi:hypothetical protein